MVRKHSILVRNTEKELYRIFKDLERYGRCAFSYPDKRKQQSISRALGKRIQPLANAGLIIPPLSRDRRYRYTGVMLPTNINVKIEEKKTKKGSKFYFRIEK